MPYTNAEDEIKWRENNRDWHKSPINRAKQAKARRLKRQLALQDAPDKYEYDTGWKKKSQLKYTWNKKGLRMSQFEEVWDKYCSTDKCELCDISLKKVKKNMDHHHQSGYFRFVVCQRCNAYLRYRDKRLDQLHLSLLF
tara:strand:+ start:198 stop:614 length:417 start_codon:yes stop_codon:yes gene_type:complete